MTINLILVELDILPITFLMYFILGDMHKTYTDYLKVGYTHYAYDTVIFVRSEDVLTGKCSNSNYMSLYS